MVVKIPDLKAAAPYYGGQPSNEAAVKLKHLCFCNLQV